MEQELKTFYQAFNALDAETMVNLYHDDVVFKDPAFGTLKGNRAKNMWRMLCASQKGQDFKVSCCHINANQHQGHLKWEAFYTFSKTQRQIHNTINAQFTFKAGKIITHTDTFNLYNWARQALGLKGALIGWTPFFKRKLQQQTNQLLNRFEQNTTL
ncbi:limonene-1,2-epoxide hydrolase [Mangrovimonas yunxiaonensis]|uniref:Limonene-1,2-epoxide hydrolase n=1 Tax=Mangrovimonas yunxiaonensis TaxID=1197477 RepID=A0A084THR3_9FLAO|nr:nuclear transport factor 2 family protein [Mangrovimonas yunxiaonensis]KFB00249.1 limonene-1,2-epoxide hydrolase [Mangrovimonas yunxiaonensis]GGH42849.1 ketosteroid isomerase [Mangrovimonas yunxiaonensis]